MRVLILAFLISLSGVVLAEGPHLENCRKSASSIKTPMGTLLRYTCPAPPSQPKWLATWQTLWTLGDQVLLQGAGDISAVSKNQTKDLALFSDFNDPTLSCPARMYLIDLTGDKPRVFAFGVKNACAEYHWASWGKKRSVIAVKENIRFTYSNGKLNPPPADFGDGTPLLRRYPEDAQSQRNWPFVEELPIK